MLILIAGLPGSGKTTFARALAASIAAVHISSDTIRHSLGLAGQYEEKSKNRVYRAMQQAIVRQLSGGQIAIVDSTFYRASIRNNFLRIAEKHNVSTHIFKIEAAPETIEERVSKKRAESEADFQVYLKIKANFEPIRQGYLSLRSDLLSIEEMVGLSRLYLSIQ